MKNKFVIIASAVVLFNGSLAFAQEEKGEDNFAKHKAEIIANLNQEKSIIDAEISCMNSAQKKEDAEKCRDQKKSGMKNLHQKRIEKRKAHLQEQLKNLDEKSSANSQKSDR